ncbi:MAG: hypothetical protein AAF690_29985 [Acidobacteriota bacterium]
MKLDLFLIDGIGPFFRGLRGRTNWSKVPFEHLEDRFTGEVDRHRFRSIHEEFRDFCRRVSDLGFNAVTLDDVAHLAPWDGHSPSLRRRIDQYREEYWGLFETAREAGLEVFLTSDLMPYSQELLRETGRRPRASARWMAEAVDRVLADFPQVKGAIFRFGESDGRDVGGDLRSELVVRTPRHLHDTVATLLPVFERRQRLCVVRTWSVGAYGVGDLMWNRNTFDRVFSGLESDALVVSMKPGESDFFRFLPLNPLFFHSDHQKIVELQARREYEGFGEFPSFVGWLHARYREALEKAPRLIGMSLWCQTGGWTRFRRRTYLGRSSAWNELNVEVTLSVFKNRNVETGVEEFLERRDPEASTQRMMSFLRLAESAIEDLWYVDDVARQELYFRRLRLPPILTVFWDNILINHGVRKLLRNLVYQPQGKIDQGGLALEKIERMIGLAESLPVPLEDLLFQRDTFEILQLARRYYFGRFSSDLVSEMTERRRSYQSRYDPRFSVLLDFSPWRIRRSTVRRFWSLLVRDQRAYRSIDRVVLLRSLAPFAFLLRPLSHRVVPDFAKETTMGLSALFK